MGPYPAGWRGWQHDRWIYFYHNGGPIVILDEAHGPAWAKAGLLWHLVGGEEVAAGHFRLRGSDAPVEARLIHLSDGRMGVWEKVGSAFKWNLGSWNEAHLQTVVMLLPGSWVGAEVIRDKRMLEIRTLDDKLVYLPIPSW